MWVGRSEILGSMHCSGLPLTSPIGAPRSTQTGATVSASDRCWRPTLVNRTFYPGVRREIVFCSFCTQRSMVASAKPPRKNLRSEISYDGAYSTGVMGVIGCI